MSKLHEIKFTEEPSNVAGTAYYKGSFRDTLEKHFECARRDEHITRVEFYGDRLQAFMAKGPRP